MGEVKNITGNEGVEKIKELAKAADICHFVTSLNTHPLQSRPMSTQDVDDDGNLYFFSKAGSDKNTDIEKDSSVQLLYANGSSYEYLSVYGKAEIIKDAALAEKLWTPMVKTWFPDGPADPELTILKVVPADAYYWDTKNNKMISLIKIIAGSITGKTADIGIQGAISV